jgi:O-antigen chain-terminating methyltransferase
VIDLVALAADKVRPGGRVFLETVNPQSLYVFAHAFYLDPTHVRPVHPAYLAFLFREAGFAAVDIEWRSPPPPDDVLEEVRSEHTLPGAINANVKRLNQLLFAPQDYLLAAVR